MNQNRIHPSRVNPIPAGDLELIHGRAIGDYEPQEEPPFDPQHGGVSQVQRAMDDPASWEPVRWPRLDRALRDVLLVGIAVLFFGAWFWWLLSIGK